MEMKDAVYIGTHDESFSGKIGKQIVTIYPQDIKINLECNMYDLNLDFIQDFSCVVNGHVELYQGHSLREIEVDLEDIE